MHTFCKRLINIKLQHTFNHMNIETTWYYFIIAILTPYEYCKAYKLNNERALYGLSLLALVAIWRLIPLSYNCVEGLLGFFGFSVLFLKSKIQKKDETLFVFAILFLILSLSALMKHFL